MKRKTTEQFIKDVKKIYGNKYDYSLVEYSGAKNKIKIVCKKHGMFNQTPSNHLNGNGCPLCNGGIKFNIINFIKIAENIHGDKYDYSLVRYINSQTKVKIICKKHGVFEQQSNSHLMGHGCPLCNGGIKSDTINFIKDVIKTHGNKYDYSLVKYINAHTKVKIICKEHGIFEQIPNSHLNGNGCPLCRNIKLSNLFKKPKINFIKDAIKVHNNKYDYSLVNYCGMHKKLKIICSIHGVFEQTPNNHIRGQNCPKCKESKGEKEIRNILESNDIIFESQKRFKDCRNINPLPFDFYLPKQNICIEFDGIQHFKEMSIWGGVDEFERIKIRDKIKNEYCENNNIRLIRIRYDEDIKEKLYLSVFSDSSFVSSAM